MGDCHGPEGHRKLRPLSPVRYLAVYRHGAIDRVSFLGTRPTQTKLCNGSEKSTRPKHVQMGRWIFFLGEKG